VNDGCKKAAGTLGIDRRRNAASVIRNHRRAASILSLAAHVADPI